MRMPEAGSEAVYATLTTIPAVTALVGTRIVNLATWPLDIVFPAAMHYAEPGGGGYGGSIAGGGLPETVGLRYVVRFGSEGESTDAIDAAAEAVLARFSAGPLVSPAGFQVIAEALEPWPQMFSYGVLVEGGDIYRQTGDFYSLEVLRYG